MKTHSLSLSLSVFATSLLRTCSLFPLHRYNSLSLYCPFLSFVMDTEPDKRFAPSTSSSSSCASDRLVDTEIEAAETLADLAQLAMRETTATDSADRPHPATPRFAPESPTHDSDLSHSAPPPGEQVVSGQQLDEKPAISKSVETERIQQDHCSRYMKVEQDADSLKTTSYSVVRSSKSRRNLTEEEKEARRIRRVLANRESARQTIRRRQALCEELTRKAANLVLENENLKKEKELALKEYQSLETTNKHLKAQIAKSINTEVEKTPLEQDSSVAEVTTLSGNGPWFVYNHFPVTQLFWPSIIQSSSPVQVQHTPFNSIAIPSNVSVPCSSETDSYYKQNNLVNDNRTQNPLYMLPCPWLFPLPEFGNGQPPSSIGQIDKRDELSLGKQCSSSSSLNTVANVDYQAALPIKPKTEASGWTQARYFNDTGHAATRFPLDGAEQKTGCHIVGNLHGPSLDCNGHATAVKQELELHLPSAPNTEVSLTAPHIATSSPEKKQAKFICSGKSLVDTVAAAEARKRRKELTKLKGNHNRQSRMNC